MQPQPIPKIPAKGAALEPWQQSLSDAIIGHTRDYVIQQIGKQPNAVIHAKDLFRAPNREFPWPEVGRAFSIHYSRAQAIAREIRERLREEGRSR
jgi:hypothetical protein